MGFPGGSAVKNSPADAGDTGDVGSIPGLGRSPGGGYGSTLQYSCLENPMDRGASQATVHGVTKSQTQLSKHTKYNYIYICADTHTHIHTHIYIFPVLLPGKSHGWRSLESCSPWGR